MISILRSPRNRRRLAWAVATPLAIAGAVLATAVWLPEATPDPPEKFGNQQAVNVAAHEKAVRLTPTDRKLVNQTIDILMNDGVKRQNPQAVYDVASPGLRNQATRAEWRTGEIPVYPYPARGEKFHGWSINYSQRNHLNVDLLVMPAKDRATLGPVALTIDLLKQNRRWLVDGLFPVATFAPLPPQGNRGPVISTYDLVPAAAGAAPTGHRTRISYAYFFLPGAIIGGGIAVVIGFFVWRGIRDRRAHRRYLAQRSLQSQ